MIFHSRSANLSPPLYTVLGQYTLTCTKLSSVQLDYAEEPTMPRSGPCPRANPKWVRATIGNVKRKRKYYIRRSLMYPNCKLSDLFCKPVVKVQL